MLIRLFLLTLLCFSTAQAETVLNTSPALKEVFPLAIEGEKVVNPHPIMLSLKCIVPTGSWMRTIFVIPGAEDSDVKRTPKKQEQEAAYSRMNWKTAAPEMTPLQRATYERGIKTVWKMDTPFRASMGNLLSSTSRIVFQRPNESDIQMENFDFPDGLFLAEVNGKVIVLAVQEDSKASHAQVTPQSELLSINDSAVKNLGEFQTTYAREKSKSGATNLKLMLHKPKSEETYTVSFSLPRSLNSDFWSEIDEKNAATAAHDTQKPTEQNQANP